MRRLVLFSGILLAAACASAEPRPGAPAQASSSEATSALRDQAKSILGVVPATMESPTYNPATPEKVELGKMLYFEPRLSLSQAVSCNSCHNLAAGGTDNLPRSLGHGALQGGRNSPTVYNAGLHVAQFWDGRAITLEDQAAGPITNPVEMAMPADDRAHARLMAVLKSMPEYRARFETVYGKAGDPINMRNITYAIAAFERTLGTPGRFDRWLEGDDSALTELETQGLQTFMEVGCTACHNGPAVGGQMFQKLGVVKPWPNQDDAGRFAVTGDEPDRMVFKVMGLRNIELTAPYFHDSSTWSLDEAVRMMGSHQLGQELSQEQVMQISAFLRALTGNRPKIELPLLPPSTPETPTPVLPAAAAAATGKAQ